MNESVISLKQADYGHSNSHLHHSTLHLPSHFTNLTNHVNTKSLSNTVGKCQLSTNSSSPSPSASTNVISGNLSSSVASASPNGSSITVTNLLGTFKSDSLVTHTPTHGGTLIHSLGKCNNNNLLPSDHMAIGGGNSVISSSKIHYQNGGSHGPGVNGTSSSKNLCSNGATEIVYLDSEGDENMISPPPEDNVDESTSCIEVIDHEDDDDDDDDITGATSRVTSHRSAATLSPRADRFLTESSTSVQNSSHQLNVNPMLTSTPTKSPAVNGNSIVPSVGDHSLPPLNSSVDSSLLELTTGGLFDPSLISRVNLTAAFHDHLPCTKIYRKILPYSSHSSGLTNSTSVLGSVGVGDSLMSIMSPLKSTHPSHHHHHNTSHHRPPSNPDHLDYVDTSLTQVSSTNCNCSSYSEEREQITFLQEIILSHFDLIEFQKEQIQKKDRQLLALKQDREGLLSRNEKLEKKVKFLSKKLVSFAESKQAVVSVSSVNGDTSSTASGQSKCGSMQNGIINTGDSTSGNEMENGVSTASSNLLKAKKGKIKSNSTLSASVKIDGQTPSKKKRSVSTTGPLALDGSSPNVSPSKKKNRTPSTSVNCKSQTSSNLLSDGIDTSCDSSSSIPSGIGGSGSSSSNATTPLPQSGPVPLKRKLPIMKDFLTTDEPYEVVQMRDPTYEAACLARRSKLSIQAGVVVRNNCPSPNGKVNGTNGQGHGLTNGKLASSPSFTGKGKSIAVTTQMTTSLTATTAMSSNSHEPQCDIIPNKSGNITSSMSESTKASSKMSSIEVPSWRIINILPSTSSDGSEALDDDVFLKRHNKLELDERRRKR